MTDGVKTKKVLDEIGDAFIPLQKILNRFPENIYLFERSSNTHFEINYDKELKEYRMSVRVDFVEAHLGESGLTEEQLSTGLF